MRKSPFTRVEVIAELREVLSADFTTAVVVKKCGCPDCLGSGIKGTNETNVTSCATCSGTGLVDEETIDVKAIPKKLRPMVTGFKLGRQGKLLPEFRNKDQAAAQLIKIMGLDKPTLRAMRDAYGDDLKSDTASAPEKQELTKDRLIEMYQAVVDDPMSTNGEILAALKELSVLKGYRTEDGADVDNSVIGKGEVLDLLSRVFAGQTPPQQKA